MSQKLPQDSAISRIFSNICVSFGAEKEKGLTRVFAQVRPEKPWSG